jgi:hypothetical protein
VRPGRKVKGRFIDRQRDGEFGVRGHESERNSATA